MLAVAEERLLERNPAARLRLYWHEINDHSYAICTSGMIAKAQDAGNIRLGDTLADDQIWDHLRLLHVQPAPPFRLDPYQKGEVPPPPEVAPEVLPWEDGNCRDT